MKQSFFILILFATLAVRAQQVVYSDTFLLKEGTNAIRPPVGGNAVQLCLPVVDLSEISCPSHQLLDTLFSVIPLTSSNKLLSFSVENFDSTAGIRITIETSGNRTFIKDIPPLETTGLIEAKNVRRITAHIYCTRLYECDKAKLLFTVFKL